MTVPSTSTPAKPPARSHREPRLCLYWHSAAVTATSARPALGARDCEKAPERTAFGSPQFKKEEELLERAQRRAPRAPQCPAQPVPTRFHAARSPPWRSPGSGTGGSSCTALCWVLRHWWQCPVSGASRSPPASLPARGEQASTDGSGQRGVGHKRRWGHHLSGGEGSSQELLTLKAHGTGSPCEGRA